MAQNQDNIKREPVLGTGFSYEKDFIKSEATHYLLGGTLPDARYEKNMVKF